MRYSSLSEHAGLAMQYDLLALHALRDVCPQYIPWSDAALRPAAIQIAVNEIALNKCKVVVEFGCGISTLFLTERLSREGGHLVSFDHDAQWISELSSRLTAAQRNVVTFILAPLVASTYEETVIDWYDSDVVHGALANLKLVDLVLVDGPPAYQKKFCLNRGPAIHHLRPVLAPNAAILLDDIHRQGEQHIANRWSELLGQQYRALTIEAGVAFWRLGLGFNTSQ